MLEKITRPIKFGIAGLGLLVLVGCGEKPNTYENYTNKTNKEKMASYSSAFDTTLEQYLTERSLNEGISKEDLQKKIQIKRISIEHGTLFGSSKNGAIKDFDEWAKDYDIVVELSEKDNRQGLIGLLYKPYKISGTGIKFNS